MKTEMRRKLAQQSFEEKIRKVGELIRLSRKVKAQRVCEDASTFPRAAKRSTDGEATEERAFREQCRRQMARPLESRMKYGFCRVHRPILDDPGVRSFSSTAEYRRWCADHLPPYLGFQPAS